MSVFCDDGICGAGLFGIGGRLFVSGVRFLFGDVSC